jgi:hypothetical protein
MRRALPGMSFRSRATSRKSPSKNKMDNGANEKALDTMIEKRTNNEEIIKNNGVNLGYLQDKEDYNVDYRLPSDSRETWNSGFLQFQFLENDQLVKTDQDKKTKLYMKNSENYKLKALVKNSSKEIKADFIVKIFSDRYNVSKCRTTFGSSLYSRVYRIDLISDDNKIYSFDIKNKQQYNDLESALTTSKMHQEYYGMVSETFDCNYLKDIKSGGKKRKTFKKKSKRKKIKKTRKKTKRTKRKY